MAQQEQMEMPAEVSRQEFDMMVQQLAEMRQQLEASQEQNAELEQSMQNLVEGLQAEKDEASKDGFFQNYQQEFAGDRDMSDRAWQMYEDSGRADDEREFVSLLVSQMDDQMLKYLAAKGILSMVDQSEESEPLEVSGEESPEEDHLEGEALEEEQAIGTEAGGELDPEGIARQEPSSREKINRLLAQND